LLEEIKAISIPEKKADSIIVSRISSVIARAFPMSPFTSFYAAGPLYRPLQMIVYPYPGG